MHSHIALKGIISQYRTSLVSVFLLTFLETSLYIIQFYFIGKAINDLLVDSWTGVYILCGLFILKFVISFFKQRQLTETYNKIYSYLVSEAIVEVVGSEVQSSDVAANSLGTYAVASFVKNDLIKGFETLLRLVLVLVMLFVLCRPVFWASLGIALLVFLLYAIRRRKSQIISKDLAQLLRYEYHLLEQKVETDIYENFKKQEKLDGQLLAISGTNLSIIELFSFGLMLFALVILVKTEGQEAIGTFFSLMYYVFAFTETMMTLPSIFQKYIRTQAISLGFVKN